MIISLREPLCLQPKATISCLYGGVNMLRRFVSVVPAVVALMCVSSLQVSAAGIKDLNGDGNCTIGDVIFLNRY